MIHERIGLLIQAAALSFHSCLGRTAEVIRYSDWDPCDQLPLALYRGQLSVRRLQGWSRTFWSGEYVLIGLRVAGYVRGFLAKLGKKMSRFKYISSIFIPTLSILGDVAILRVISPNSSKRLHPSLLRRPTTLQIQHEKDT